MKLKFHDSAGDDVRSLVWPKEVGGSSLRRLPARQRGIALVVTLILLAVVTFMAVTFLALSRRERGAVTTVTDTATARLAADAALANAQAQIIANIFATTNAYAYDYGLLVSTNYINANGFNPAAGANPTNVNYYDSSGNFLTGNNFLTNVANLYYLPRAPVFVPSPPDNYVNPTNYDFRFYLDLNRNGRFDTNGVVANVDNNNKTVGTGTITEVGDPEWIGILEHPDAPHGPNNPFIARYAFIATPADNALDLNHIHNQVFDEPSSPTTAAISVNPPPTSDGFFRNQGVGSWEINLAAFLADLNTNEWGQVIGTPANGNDTYYYYQYLSKDNQGDAFSDARALLAYRYSNNYNSLTNADALFTNMAAYPYNIDLYSDGPLQTTFNTNANLYPDNPDLPWAGADNINHFFDMQELFNPSETSTFATNLLNAGTNTFGGSTVSTYDRYTFYRLLSQLGTDSSAESGKLNLNYRNVTNGVIIPGMETNFYPWTALEFFTNAADRMLRLYTTNWFQTNPSNYLATYYGIITNYYYTDPSDIIHTNDPSGLGLTFMGWTNTVPAFGITNIPVWINGRFVYSPAINRVLQLAANIYDATTNIYDDGFPFPSVFRPIFNVVGTNVYISGFSEVTNAFETTDYPLSTPYNLANPTVFASLSQGVHSGLSAINVFGVPMIIGAKKGLPNFNQFAMQNIFQITRKLQLTRQTTNSLPSTYKINQMFTLGSATNSGIADQLEVECWNSYSTNYSQYYARSTDIYVTNWLTMNLTNDEGFSTNYTFTVSGSTNVTQWPGYNSTAPASSFVIPLPLTTAALVPPNSVYRFNVPGIPYITTVNQSSLFESNVVINGSSYPQPHWGLIVTNNLQVAMVDHLTGRLIDYVQLSGPDTTRDLNAEILGLTNYAALWLTNYVKSGVLPTVSLPEGIENQLQESKLPQYWDASSADGFNNFVQDGLGSGNAYGSTNLQFQTYSPPTTIYQATAWQVNDPLVHYMAADLFDSANNVNAQPTAINPLISLTPNERYQPWGTSVQMARLANVDQSPANFIFKDPLTWSSDNWNFPTNKFPTVGWLGRVHRGTPWQTVYLKASDILRADNGLNTWMNWTGNFNTNDAINAGPVQDRLLFDLFTTAPNDNATRGQLSVNVGAVNGASLAAWSALFSGIMVLSNNASDASYPAGILYFHRFNPLGTAPFIAQPVNPAGASGTNSPLGQLAVAINATRENTNFFPQQIFTHVGDILATPQLTEQSPFLHLNNGTQPDSVQLTNGISDEMYEWLPQQMMSLLRVSSVPRYVIYSYGQTLKPAPNGISTASGSFGLVTNYQIVSETATRAVVQVHSTLVTNNLNHLVTTNYSTTIEQFNTLPSD